MRHRYHVVPDLTVVAGLAGRMPARAGLTACGFAEPDAGTIAGLPPLRTKETVMQPMPSLAMLQFLAWVADRQRNHADVMDAWQSSCPRLSVWEDAVIDGYAQFAGDAARNVVLTPRGRAVLDGVARDSARLAADQAISVCADAGDRGIAASNRAVRRSPTPR